MKQGYEDFLQELYIPKVQILLKAKKNWNFTSITALFFHGKKLCKIDGNENSNFEHFALYLWNHWSQKNVIPHFWKLQTSALKCHAVHIFVTIITRIEGAFGTLYTRGVRGSLRSLNCKFAFPRSFSKKIFTWNFFWEFWNFQKNEKNLKKFSPEKKSFFLVRSKKFLA